MMNIAALASHADFRINPIHSNGARNLAPDRTAVFSAPVGDDAEPTAPSAPEPTPVAPIDPLAPEPSDPIAPDPTKTKGAGVLRLLEAGHFQGVADVRLRINFHDDLAAAGITDLPEITPPKGNGVAFAKFMETYNSMIGGGDVDTPTDGVTIEPADDPTIEPGVAPVVGPGEDVPVAPVDQPIDDPTVAPAASVPVIDAPRTQLMTAQPNEVEGAVNGSVRAAIGRSILQATAGEKAGLPVIGQAGIAASITSLDVIA